MSTHNASLERTERRDDTLQDLVRLCWRFARHQLNPDNIPLPTWARIGCEMLAELREIDPVKYDDTMKPNTKAEVSE